MISYFLWGERNCWSPVAFFFPPIIQHSLYLKAENNWKFKEAEKKNFLLRVFWVCYGISLPLPVSEEAKVPSRTWSQCTCLEFLAWDDREIELYWYIVHFHPRQTKNACSCLGQERFPAYIHFKEMLPSYCPKGWRDPDKENLCGSNHGSPGFRHLWHIWRL